MAIFSTTGVSIHSIAAAVPGCVVSNLNYELITPAERQFLIKTIGVRERRLAPDSITTSDLCFAAAKELLGINHIDTKEIGLLVFVSQSNDYYLPATAATLQQRLALEKHTMAFDVGLGCSGYVYGLTLANSLMQTCGIKKALLLAGDVSTTTCSPEDKSTYPLFGDAGTATLLEQNSSPMPWYGNMMTDGSGADAIIIRDGMQRHKMSADSFKAKDAGEGIRRAPLHLALKGEEIFAFSIREVPQSINELLSYAGREVNHMDFFIMHQANLLINETIRKKLKVPSEKVPYSIDEFGNTSSASIPLTLVTRLADQLRTPQRLLLSGFGVGLSWGNLLIDSTSINCLPLIEA
jgi:3-oxoacyl-[acyl-carrier-protein] synthase-3